MNLSFAESCLFVLMPNSMSKLIRNRCTFKLTTAASAEITKKQVRVSLLVFSRYFVVLDVHL